MDYNRREDSGEMYSPDEQGEYTPLDGIPRFSMQGLSDALADVREGITEPPVEEYAMMPIFKSTDPGLEVTYTLWRFDVDAFLEQYDEASMRPHIYASLHGYPGKWAHTLVKGKDISVQDLLMHMEKTFGNKCDYDAMIRTLYEVQQKEDKTVEEYMLCIHDTVAAIRRAYPEPLPDCGRVLKKDRFYHGLHPYLHDALSFAMAELPEREQACPTFDTLYTLAKKLEAGQPARPCHYATGSDAYREKHRCYPAPAGRVVALEEEGVALADPASREDSRFRRGGCGWSQCVLSSGNELL